MVLALVWHICSQCSTTTLQASPIIEVFLLILNILKELEKFINNIFNDNYIKFILIWEAVIYFRNFD